MFLENETATLELGKRIANLTPDSFVIYLKGDLGAGKTCLARGFIQGLGHTGRVKSPTYTIVEPYDVSGRRVYHLDLYRLADPQELEFLGIRDLSAEAAVLLIEWPERGHECLPGADLEILLQDSEEKGNDGRLVEFHAASQPGQDLLDQLQT